MLALQRHLPQRAFAGKQKCQQHRGRNHQFYRDVAGLQYGVGLQAYQQKAVQHDGSKSQKHGQQQRPHHREVTPDGMQHGYGVIFQKAKNQRIYRRLVKPEVMQINQREHDIEERHARCDTALHLARHPGQHQQQHKPRDGADLQVKPRTLYQCTKHIALGCLVVRRPKIR